MYRHTKAGADYVDWINSIATARNHGAQAVTRRLPPMGALEAFVAVARSGSLRLASEELNLSVSALSRRVQSLEIYVDRPLFQRLHHELRLTVDGEWLLERIDGNINALSTALGELHDTETRTLRIAMPPSFAASWMLPRYAAFRAAYPLIDLKFDTSQPLSARPASGVDLAILLAESVDDGFYAKRLKQQLVYAVCTPQLASQLGKLRTPHALSGQTLLVHRDLIKLLDVWRSAVGAPEPGRIETFDSGPTLFEATANGLGIALAIDDSVASYLHAGRLTRPFDEQVVSPFAYHFVCRSAAFQERAVRLFHDWLFAEITNTASSGARPAAGPTLESRQKLIAAGA